MKRNDKSESRINLANYIAMTGMALLLIFSCLGLLYKTGGEWAISILVSVGITALAGVLLWLMIKAKTAENDLRKWRIVEYSALGLYILCAGLAFYYGGMMHFFSINGDKEEIKTKAKSDLAKIDRMFSDFQSYEDEAVAQARTSFKNITSPGVEWSDALTSFMEEKHIDRDPESARMWIDRREEDLKDEYNHYYDQYTSKRREVEGMVDGWSMLQIAINSDEINRLASTYAKELSDILRKEEVNIPVFHDDRGIYTFDGYAVRDFSVEGGVDSLEFRKALMESTSCNFMAVLVAVLVHALILFNYLMAIRTDVFWSKDDGQIDDGGHTL